MRKRILILGGTSQIGKHLQEIMPGDDNYEMIYLGSKDCDLTRQDKVEE